MEATLLVLALAAAAGIAKYSHEIIRSVGEGIDIVEYASDAKMFAADLFILVLLLLSYSMLLSVPVKVAENTTGISNSTTTSISRTFASTFTSLTIGSSDTDTNYTEYTLYIFQPLYQLVGPEYRLAMAAATTIAIV